MSKNTKVALIGGYRTPFVKAGTSYNNLSSFDLLKLVVDRITDSFPTYQKYRTEAFLGTVLLNPRYPNLAREVILASRLDKNVPAHFVSNNCITGLVAASMGFESIKEGRLDVAFCGGVESMSNPTLMLSSSAERFLLQLFGSRGVVNQLKTLLKFKLGMLKVIPPSPKEPSTGFTMGEHCELMVKEHQISREAQDKWALSSHHKASSAWKSGFFDDEIIEVNGVKKDGLVRGDTSLEKLSSLKPVFDRSGQGTITAGNASSLTDGASIVGLANEKFCEQNGITPLAWVDGFEFSAIAPEQGLLMAPVTAMPNMLDRLGVSVSEIDLFEIHEAFAGQVLCNLKGWEEGLFHSKKLGKISEEKINLSGGSLAIGHPFAATGGRLMLNAARNMKNAGAKRIALSACAAGAMGGVALLSRA